MMLPEIWIYQPSCYDYGWTEGAFRSLDDAICYLVEEDGIGGASPFDRAEVRCLHSPEVHGGRTGDAVEQDCDYRGVLLADADPPRLVVFHRLRYLHPNPSAWYEHGAAVVGRP
jgi:hypothetical protein